VHIREFPGHIEPSNAHSEIIDAGGTAFDQGAHFNPAAASRWPMARTTRNNQLLDLLCASRIAATASAFGGPPLEVADRCRPTTPLRLLVNPRRGRPEIGVDFLARLCGESWNSATYHWYLKREFHGRRRTRLVHREGRQVLRQPGIATDNSGTPDGTIHRVGIMVAACVPPVTRAVGVFPALGRRGCLLAHTWIAPRCSGASRRKRIVPILRRARAVQIPSSYVISDDPPPDPPASRQRLQASVRCLARLCDGALQANALPLSPDFASQTSNAWRSQSLTARISRRTVARGWTRAGDHRACR